MDIDLKKKKKKTPTTTSNPKSNKPFLEFCIMLQTLHFVLLVDVALGVFPYFSLDSLSSLGGPSTLIQFHFLSHLQRPFVKGLIRTHIVTLITLRPQVKSHLGSPRHTPVHIGPFRLTQTRLTHLGLLSFTWLAQVTFQACLAWLPLLVFV